MWSSDDDERFTADLVAGRADLTTLHDGTVLRSHGPEICIGPHCAIHNPSDHPLNAAPLSWLVELRMMFRVCSHGSMHPDPDSLTFNQVLAMAGHAPFYDGWHPCCLEHCCSDDRDADAATLLGGLDGGPSA